jgi:hypothetical protein
MTTNANKFGLRAAARERTNRHAQRTPLPPRPGDIAEAKEAVAEAAEILASIGKSERKALQFKAEAEKSGWTVEISVVDSELTELVATRGLETVHQAWTNGVWQEAASTYSIADRTLKPRNAKGALTRMSRSAEEAEAELSRVASNTFFRRRSSPEETQSKRRAQLPFTLESSDEEVIAALDGRTVKWHNRLSNTQEEAHVTRGGKYIRLVTVGEERVLQFCEHRGQGFRAFRLSDVVRVR